MNYTKGDYTKCLEDICEIWYEDNLYCIVRTDDADKIIDVLNENEQLKKELNECNRIKTKRTERMKNQRKALNDMQEALWGYKGDIKSLKKENEELKQLKQRIKELIE